MKKVSIIIGFIIVLCIILFVVVKTKDNKEERKINIEVNNVEEGKIELFEKRLKEQNIILLNKEEITSEEINEIGYSYELNGEKIEVYTIDQEKIKNITVNAEKDCVINIKSINGKRIKAIYYDEILILNCRKNVDEILKIFE